jgi:hypothetical protein
MSSQGRLFVGPIKRPTPTSSGLGELPWVELAKQQNVSSPRKEEFEVKEMAPKHLQQSLECGDPIIFAIYTCFPLHSERSGAPPAWQPVGWRFGVALVQGGLVGTRAGWGTASYKESVTGLDHKRAGYKLLMF